MNKDAENNGRGNIFRALTVAELEGLAREQHHKLVTKTAVDPYSYWLLDESLRELGRKKGLTPAELHNDSIHVLGFDRKILDLATRIRANHDNINALSGMTVAEAAGSKCEPEGESGGDGQVNTNGDGTQSHEPKSRKILRLLSDVTAESTEWLWEKYIALGELTVLEAHPDSGKSTLANDIAAHLTTGRAMPNTPKASPLTGGALFLVGEDSIAKTVVARLSAAGADLSRVAVLENVAIPDDLLDIEKAILAYGVKLIVVDTLNDFLSCNVLGNQQVRRALRPLRELAEKHNVAVLLLRHFVKSASGHSLLRGGGSVGITAMARSQIKLFHHPTDQHLRVLVHDKCNLAPHSPSLIFEVQQQDETCRLKWHGETDLTVEDLAQKPKNSPTLDAAEGFLLDKLAKGPKEVGWLVEQARGMCSKRTLDEAKKSLKIKTVREGKGKDHKVYWSLATPENTSDSKK